MVVRQKASNEMALVPTQVVGKSDKVVQDHLMQLQATCCHCWVPSQGAIVVCYGWVERDDQLWGSGRGAIGGCHRRVPLWCAMGEGDDQL